MPSRGLRRGAIALAVLVASGVPAAALGQGEAPSGDAAATAVAPDSIYPNGEPPIPSGPVDLGGEGSQSADQSQPTSSEQQASETAYTDDNASQSRSLLLSQFDDQLTSLDQQPGRALDPSDFEKFFSDNVARVDLPGAQGPQLLISSSPLRAESDNGTVQPVDLGVNPVDGHYEANNPLVDVSMPGDGGGQLRLQDANVGIKLDSANADQSPAGELEGDKVFYHDVATDTDLMEAPVSQGAELSVQLRSVNSPERLPFRVDLPQGAELGPTASGDLEVDHSGEKLASIGAPSAVDAGGSPIPTHLDQTGPDTFDLVTEHQSANALYPILVDPPIEDWYNNSWAWQGNTNFNGWTNTGNYGFLPNYTCGGAGWYCWGNSPYRGLYLGAATNWTPPANSWWQWQYVVPGQTTYITWAAFNPIYFARGGENNWSTPYAFWGTYSPTWGGTGAYTGYGSTGTGMTGGAQGFTPPTPPSAPSTLAVFGMYNNVDRSGANHLTANRAADLGGMYITMDDQENPSLTTPVASGGAPPLSSWLPEYHTVSDYQSKVLADNPSLYWRLGDNSGTTAADSSPNARSGTYVNSPALNAHGAVSEADAAKPGAPVDAGAIDLNGSTQYVSSAYQNRRNLFTNPSAELSNQQYWWTGSAQRSWDNTQGQSGSASARYTNVGSGGGFKTQGTFPAPAGTYYSAAAQVKGGGPGGINVSLVYRQAVAGTVLRTDTVHVDARSGWTRAVINGSAFGPAPANSQVVELQATNGDSATQSFNIDSVQVEQAPTAAPYFDGSSPNYHWEGTPNGSVSSSSDGPFANGTARTFEGWAYRDTNSTADTLLGGSTGSAPWLRLESGTQDVTWRADSLGTSTKTWSGAWPGNGVWVHWALVFNEPADTASLYVNGELVSTQTDTGQYNNAAGAFVAGARTSGTTPGSDPFDGKLDEIAVYDHAVSPDRIQAHYLAGPSGIGWINTTATDPGVGVQSIKLSYTNQAGQQATQTADPNPLCAGTRQGGTCLPSRTDDLPFNTNGQPLPEGISTVTASASDALAKAAAPKTFDVRVDRSSPGMQLSGGLYSQSNPGYNLQVVGTDGNAGSHTTADRPNARSGMKRIDLYIDGATTPLATTGNQPCTDSWGSCPLTLNYTLNPQGYSEGDHQFKVVATDQLGHQNSTQWTQFVDNTPPAVGSISGPMTQGWLTSGTPEVDVTASDAGAGVQKITLDVPQAGGGTATQTHTFTCNPRCPLNPTASWNIDTSTLPEGVSTLTARAYGLSGDVGTPRTAQIEVDKTPASVTSVTGPSGWLTGGTSSITASAENPVAGVDHVVLDLPGGQSSSYSFDCSAGCPATASHTFTFSVISLPNGSAEGVVHAYGPGGVASQAGHGPINVDHSAPVPTATGGLFAASGSLVGSTSGSSVQVADQGSGLGSLELKVDGNSVDTKQLADFSDQAQNCTGASCTFSADDWFDLTGVAPGQHQVTLTATDAAGNTGSVTNSVVLDPSPPSIGVTGELADFDGQPLPDDVASAAISAADSGTGDTGVKTLTIAVDGQVVATYPSTCSPGCPSQVQQSYQYRKADWGSGPHDLTITATDTAGNDTQRVITIDTPSEPVHSCTTNTPATASAVDPLPASQVVDSLEGAPDSPVAPTVPAGSDGSTDGINDQIDPALVPPSQGGGEPEPNIESAGTPVDSATSTEPAGGVTVGDLCIQPQATTAAETSAYVTPDDSGAGEAAVYANSGPQLDTVYRPTPEGGALVLNSRGASAPQSVSWTIDLDPGQQLEHLSSGGIAIVDTTVPDPPECDVPPAPAEGESIGALPDAATQLAQSEHETCVANNEIDGGVVTAVIAPPVSEDQAGDPVPVTLDYTQIPDVPPAITIDWPAGVPNKKLSQVRVDLGYDAKDCIGKPSPCGSYDAAGAVQYATRYGATPNGKFHDYGSNDCTNFMSQSLKAGNVSYMREFDTGKGSWWVNVPSPGAQSNTDSWSVADDLARHLWQYGLVEKVSHNPSNFRGGDLIAMNWDWGSNGPTDNDFDHFQIVTRGGENGDPPQMAQHSDLDYSGFTWGRVVQRVLDAGHGHLWQNWGYVVLRPVHTGANIGSPVHAWGSL